MKIGILKCGQMLEALRGTLGDYDDLFTTLLAGHGFTFASWHVEGMEFPASVHDADGWLLTGSRHGVYEDHAFIPPLEAFVRTAYAEAVPLVGVCFGHQLIAQALGGKVVKFPGGWSVGAQDYQIDGQRQVLNAWHQDQVVGLPPDAHVVGSSAFCENAVLVYGDRALTVQPHPEFDDPVIDGLIRYRGGAVPAPLLDNARARMGSADSHPAAERIAAFFDAARSRLREAS